MDKKYFLQVLILDDEVPSLRLIQSQLSQIPFVQMAGAVTTVKEAIEIIKTQAVDLVILDIELRGESGFDLLDRLKESMFEFVCLAASKDYAFKAFEYGSAGYLLKPVNEKELSTCFSRLHRYKPFIQPLTPLMEQNRP